MVIPTFTCAIAMSFIASRKISRDHLQATEQIAEITAGALSGRVHDNFGASARDVIGRLSEDPRVVMIEISDNTGAVLYRPVGDANAWAALTEVDPAFIGTTKLQSDSGNFALNRTPIRGTRASDGNFVAQGYLTLVMNDRHAQSTLMELSLWQMGLAVLVCLIVVPVIAIAVAKWTAPFQSLRQAVNQLSNGQVPPPIDSTANDDLGQLCAAFDAMVSSLYSAQQQLSQSNGHLEQIVKQRTAEVRQVNDKLESEAQDKNEFLRAVSHDLNAPMRNISGMTQMLLMKYKDDFTDDAVKKLERIGANAKHQSELIGDLLELSRLRTKDPRPVVFNLGELVTQITDSLAFDLEKAEIQLTIDGELPTIYAEKNRIRQVFQNLIDNAIKYMMDATDRRITVSVQRMRDFTMDAFEGTDVWEFKVTDTGRGIAEQDVDKVFQVFARSTHSGTHEVAGRGVGLASVKAIIEQYEGLIRVDSTLGQGSTFTFTLPVDRVTAPQANPTPDENPSTNTESADEDASLSDPAHAV